MTQVTFIQSVSGPYGAFVPGSTADIEERLASKLVQAGFCRFAEPKKEVADATPVREVAKAKADATPVREVAKAKADKETVLMKTTLAMMTT